MGEVTRQTELVHRTGRTSNATRRTLAHSRASAEHRRRKFVDHYARTWLLLQPGAERGWVPLTFPCSAPEAPPACPGRLTMTTDTKQAPLLFRLLTNYISDTRSPSSLRLVRWRLVDLGDVSSKRADFRSGGSRKPSKLQDGFKSRGFVLVHIL